MLDTASDSEAESVVRDEGLMGKLPVALETILVLFGLTMVALGDLRSPLFA